MIQMRVDSIQLDPRNMQPILVLCDDAKMRALPIWIGSAEANAIARSLMNVESPRPKTHHLLSKTIKELGFTVKHVEINELTDDTFFASILLNKKGEDGVVTLDARPSDAVALALISDVPIFVAPSVVAESSYPVDAERDEAEAAAFKDFLEDLTVSDFIRHASLPADASTADNAKHGIETDDRRSDAA
jgi:bifunctional DNase/RNase